MLCEPGGENSWISSSSLEFHFLLEHYLMALYQEDPWRDQSLLCWAQGNVCALLTASKITTPPYHGHHSPGFLELHIPHQPLLVFYKKVQPNTSSHWLLYHLEKEVVVNAFQESPGLPIPSCVVPPADVGVVDVSHRNQDMSIWGHSSLRVEDPISLIFLFRQPQTYYKIAYLCSPFNLGPLTPSQLLIYP